MTTRFYCVNDTVPLTTINLLQAACAARGIEFVEVDCRMFDFDERRRLMAGDLLYCPATSVAAMRVEQFLYQTGVATFYSEPNDLFMDVVASPLLFQRAGLSVPRTVYCATTNRDLLKKYAETVGGFPLVVKVLGYANGVGVVRIDSWPAFFSFMDYALSQNRNPLVCEYIPDAVHWRLIVVGDQVVAAYTNRPQPDDFRTYVGDDLDDFTAPPPPGMNAIAVRALQVLHVEFGGVDILERPDPDGASRQYLLEANFPCYFGHAQVTGKVDVAGAMVDYLLAKARRLAENLRGL